MDNIQLKRVNTGDIHRLIDISRQTFLEAFSEVNSPENMSKHLDQRYSEEQLTTELANTDSAFYFAMLEDRVIGYLKLNTGTAQTELQHENSLEIERIYVLKAFYGKRVGQLLYEKAVEAAVEKNADFIWLGVWEENIKAISFYRKNGFIEFDKHHFMLGDDKQTDLMMKRMLPKEDNHV